MATSENLKDAAGNADPSPPSLPGTGTSSPAPTSAGNARRQAFLRSASIPTLEQAAAPRLKPRWLFAEGKGKGWATFGLGDSGRIEKGWGEWRGEVREGKVEAEHEQEQEGKGEKEGQNHFDLPPADPTQPLPSWRVPVGEDRLFEVDVRSSPPSSSSSSFSPTTPGMHPVFWRGPRVEVRRGEWFFESSRLAPCPAELSRELEEHYAKIGPWTSAYADELKASASIGAEGEEKLICRLTTLKSSYVIFSGSHLARIYTEGMSTRLAKTLLTAWAGEHGGGTVVVRGYDQVQKLLKARRGDVSSGGSGKKQKGKHNRGGAGTGEASQTSTPVKGSKALEGGEQQQQGEKTETDEGAAAKAGRESSDTQQSSTDIWTSLTSKFNSWSSTTKAQQDAVAASFKEAQRHTQDLPPADRDSEVDVTSDDSDDEEAHELALEREAESEEVELVFCWHGIGQKLAEEWKSLEFSLAVNSFKSLLRKRAHAPPPAHVGGEGMAKLTRGKRLVLVPIDWRTTLNDFKPGRRGGGGQEGEGEEEEEEGEPPQLEDIFGPPSSIPLARQITKNLLLDIPLYLSHHKAEVLRRCIAATNRAYALFLQRNPGFNPSSSTKKKGGKVSLICHSLGCAIAVDVLSAQPSTVGEGKRGLEEITTCKHLAFDVRNLYFCGSPAALFFYLESRQLGARRRHGRGRGHDAPDEGEGKPSSSSSSSLDRPTWGSLPVSSIWNVLHSTDPIGTHLNGCVDRHYARERAGPVQVDRVVEAILGGLKGAKTVASSRVNRGEKAGAGGGREGPSGSSGFFASWGRTTESSTAVAAQDKAASGASSPTTPPADLGEVPTNKKAKRKSGASGLLSKGKDGLGLDAVTTATASLKAQQWAAKFAQSKLTGTTTTTTAQAQPAAAAGSEGGEEATPGPSDPTEVEHAGKTSYPPPPVPAPVEADAQLAEEMEEAMQDAKPQAEDKTKPGLAGDDATKPEVEEEEAETIAQHRAKERDEGREEEGKATTARDTGEDHEDEHKLSATRRERAHDRFLALNPLGRIDYILPKPAPSLLVPAAMLEYVQMLQAHAGYWSSEAFADFVLATSAICDDDGGGIDGGGDGEEGERGNGKGAPTWGEVRGRLFGDEDSKGEGKGE